MTWRSRWGLGLGVQGGGGVGMWLEGGWIKAGSRVQHMRSLEFWVQGDVEPSWGPSLGGRMG